MITNEYGIHTFSLNYNANIQKFRILSNKTSVFAPAKGN